MNEINAVGQSPRATRHMNIGDWLWCELMDYCKERGMPPASSDRLFAIVGRARAEWDTRLQAANDAASDALTALEMVADEDDLSRAHGCHAILTSGVRLVVDAALIKAGRKAAPVRQKPCETCGGRGEVGGWRQGDGYGSDPCPDCSPNSSKAAPTAVRHVTIAGVRDE